MMPLQNEQPERNSDSFTTKRNTSTAIYIRQHLKAIRLGSLPSFLARRLMDESQKPDKVFPTTHLNGLRGLFSFVVFVRQFLLPWRESLERPYARMGDECGGMMTMKVV
jgi:hypothetical protein